MSLADALRQTLKDAPRLFRAEIRMVRVFRRRVFIARTSLLQYPRPLGPPRPRGRPCKRPTSSA